MRATWPLSESSKRSTSVARLLRTGSPSLRTNDIAATRRASTSGSSGGGASSSSVPSGSSSGSSAIPCDSTNLRVRFCMVTTFFGAESFGGDAAYVDRLSRACCGAGTR